MNSSFFLCGDFNPEICLRILDTSCY